MAPQASYVALMWRAPASTETDPPCRSWFCASCGPPHLAHQHPCLPPCAARASAAARRCAWPAAQLGRSRPRRLPPAHVPAPSGRLPLRAGPTSPARQRGRLRRPPRPEARRRSAARGLPAAGGRRACAERAGRTPAPARTTPASPSAPAASRAPHGLPQLRHPRAPGAGASATR
eukprot:scaffold14896_cov111-Isochrysis_galbana.AAC.15